MKNTNAMQVMPTMPRAAKIKPVHPCACGCGMPTKSTWHSGHDGRAMGWALRVTRGLLTIDEVPSNEVQGAKIMIERLNREAAKVSKTA